MRWTPVIVLAAACGGSQARTQVDLDPVPEPVTRAALSGPLCEPERCRCRDLGAPGDGGAGLPGEGVKRFEVRVGPFDNALWVTIGEHVLYKSDERAEECFYVDLPPGKHGVTIQANRGGGFSAAVAISELGAQTGSWYETFRFACGAPGACSYDQLDAWKASLAKYTRGIHDACGSVKIEGMGWQAGRAPDQQHPQDLQLELTLDVYKFAPDKPHGHPECADRIAE